MIRLALAIVASLVVPALAHAAPGDATRLEYARSARAARCPDRDALKSAVTKRLGYDPFFPAARQTIVVEITDVDEGLRAQMHLVNESGIIVGSRELEDKTEHCDELVASLALAISIALDPSAALGEEPSPPAMASNDTRKAPATAPEAAAAAETAPKNKDAQSIPRAKKGTPEGNADRFAFPSTLRVAAFSTLGVAPSLAFGLRAGIGLRWHWFQLLAELADQFPATRTVDGVGSARASLYTGTLGPCIVRGLLAGCAVFNLGSLQAEGRDVEYPVKPHSLFAALGARVELTPHLTRQFQLLLSADALRSLTPVSLRLHGEQVWKTPLLSAALAVGLAWQFP